MNQNNMSLNYIENIKSKLKKWEEELKIELLKKSNREKDIYLINKEWLFLIKTIMKMN